MHRSRLATAVVVAAVSVFGLAALPAVAQTPTTLTFKELGKGSTFKVVDIPPRQTRKRPSFSTGDQVVLTNPLKKSATTTAGKLHVSCVVTSGAKTLKDVRAMCHGAYVFAKGTIYAAALTGFNLKTFGIVTGGTGAYANARGTFETTQLRNGAITSISLTP